MNFEKFNYCCGFIVGFIDSLDHYATEFSLDYNDLNEDMKERLCELHETISCFSMKILSHRKD